jgi:hypothetical protein
LEFADGIRQASFRGRDFLTHLVAALAFLPREIPAMAIKPLLLRSEVRQRGMRVDDVRHDALHQREHLAGGGKIEDEFLSPRFAGSVSGPVRGAAAHCGLRVAAGRIAAEVF